MRLILSSEKERIRASYPDGDYVIALIEIIRSLDFRTYILGHSLKPKDQHLLEKFKYGWALPFQMFFAKLTPGDVPVFASSKAMEEWADSVIQHGGSIKFCKQFLDYKTAGLMSLEAESENKFNFYYSTTYTDEYYDKSELSFYHSLMNKILQDKVIVLNKRLPAIREKLKLIVKLMYGEFISYTATDELDEFYTTFGYLYLMTTQVIDEFDEEDIFGGYLYKDYVEIGQYICKSGIIHRDCCMALAEKTSHKVYLRNILSYSFLPERFANSYGEYMGWTKGKVKDIINCFCLNKENASYHLNSPKPASPPYFQFGTDIVMQSIFGCLDRPIYFLNRELKRRFPKDYFNAVNNREGRFKRQLYSLFKGDRFITLQENINIKVNNSATDIDAVIFDKERKVLALFQLKWQDSYYTSMKERFSRISNLIPKSVEWIDKAERWLKDSSTATILNALKIGASWYQVIEASTKLKNNAVLDPITTFVSELKLLQLHTRRQTEENEVTDDFNFKFAKYTVTVKLKV